MNVPKLRFKEFTDEWSFNRLENISSIIMGQSPNSENYTNNSTDTILIQGNADLDKGHIAPRIYTTQITKECKIDDIIMTVRAPVGDVAITEYNACIGRGVCAIKGSKYIYHYLNYLKSKDYWKKISKGSTIDSITSNDIKQLIISSPNSKLEINKIIKTLNLLDKKIELQSQKVEDLKLYKLCIMQNIFSKANMKVKLGKIADIFKGKQVNSEELLPKGKYYMLNGGITPSGYLNEYNTFENTITISEGGNSCGYVNFNKVKFWCGGHCYSLNDIKIDNNYLYQALKLNENKLMKLRVGSGLPNIQKKDLENFEFNIHDSAKQNIISNCLNKYDYKIELEIKLLESLVQLKKGLMQNMFV